MTIASLRVDLFANAAQFHREMDSAARRIERTGKIIAKAGREMTQAISLPLIAAGFAAFHALLQESTQQFGPLFTAFQGLKAELHNLFLTVGRELQPVFLELIGAMRSGIAIVQGWIQAFHNLSPGMKSVIIHTLLFLAALGPTLLIVGKLITAVGAMIKVFSLLLTPTGLIAIAIIALAAAAIYVATHWEAVSLRLMLAWTAVQEAVYGSVQGILAAFAALIEGGANASTALSGIPGVMGAAFMAMSAGLAKAADGIHNLQARVDVFVDRSLAKSAAKILEFQKRADAAAASTKTFAGETLVVDEVLKQLAGDLERAHRLAQAMGVTYNFSADQARLYQAAIKELIDKGVNPLSGIVQELATRFQVSTNDAADFARMINALGATMEQQTKAAMQFREMMAMGISPHIASEAIIAEGKIMQDVMGGIADGIEAVAMRIGDLFSGVSSRVRGFFAAIGGVLGGVMKMIGKTLVELGVVAIMYGKLGFAIKFFAKNPLASIAVGAALIALGGQLGAAAERTSSAGLSGDSSASSASSSASPGSSSQSQGSTDLVLRIESPDGIVQALFRDPRNRLALAKVLEDLSDRHVTTVFEDGE